jgi:hypothetical protein
MTLEPPPRHALSSRRLLIAALDACIVIVVGLVVSWPFGLPAWTVIACCALAYYGASSGWQGRTPAAAWMAGEAVHTVPRDTPRSEPTDAPHAEPATTLTMESGYDRRRSARERRSGNERRRSSPRPEAPPHHSEGDAPAMASLRMRSVH